MFGPAVMAGMRDRSRSRRCSTEHDAFRREHERHRAWGLQRRHAQRLRHAHDKRAEPRPAPASREDRSPAGVPERRRRPPAPAGRRHGASGRAPMARLRQAGTFGEPGAPADPTGPTRTPAATNPPATAHRQPQNPPATAAATDRPPHQPQTPPATSATGHAAATVMAAAGRTAWATPKQPAGPRRRRTAQRPHNLPANHGQRPPPDDGLGTTPTSRRHGYPNDAKPGPARHLRSSARRPAAARRRSATRTTSPLRRAAPPVTRRTEWQVSRRCSGTAGRPVIPTGPAIPARSPPHVPLGDMAAFRRETNAPRPES